MTRPTRNVAASVRDRLLNRSRTTGEDFGFLLHRYAVERFLHRLGESSHRGRFVLKGGTLFAVWRGSAYRPTRDLDLAGFGNSEIDQIRQAFREVCATRTVDDGIVFDTRDIEAEPIMEDDIYPGLRVHLRGTLGVARVSLQVDIGFGDAIHPHACDVTYPVLLNGPAPNIRAYPQETVVAEKLHALVVLGERTTRMKDIYDLYTLASQFPFDGAQLAGAISATFKRRLTDITVTLPAGLTARFYADQARSDQWQAYLRRNSLSASAPTLPLVGEQMLSFVGPIWTALAQGVIPNLRWPAGGPWEAIE